ncbi:hypothetical protein MJO28_009588 [Puccinia striiformis f. sp. tritici]|uniref:Uncharacterized protein n=1 Tax=Puccinia striiformis f. sp. tritici TaxID=168172 RepID=A0ACC0E954_9BASI|nr:hypothetical protein MJO28_009588 [Puccinia striiformis f. sp. tritici]KAI7950709.1 hypothetical protein MJO29_009383 [Puccinia striiformis f. sp. tritici]
MTARRLIKNQITFTGKRNIRPRKIDELEFASLLLVSHTSDVSLFNPGGAQQLITAGTISPGPFVLNCGLEGHNARSTQLVDNERMGLRGVGTITNIYTRKTQPDHNQSIEIYVEHAVDSYALRAAIIGEDF